MSSNLNQPRITSTATMSVDGYVTAHALRVFVNAVPDEAKISWRAERDSTVITASWDGGVTEKPSFQLPQNHVPGARGA